MTPTQKLIDERISRCDTVEQVSRLFFPEFWKSQDAKAGDPEEALEEALTLYDRPCMSYCNEY